MHYLSSSCLSSFFCFPSFLLFKFPMHYLSSSCLLHSFAFLHSFLLFIIILVSFSFLPSYLFPFFLRFPLLHFLFPLFLSYFFKLSSLCTSFVPSLISILAFSFFLTLSSSVPISQLFPVFLSLFLHFFFFFSPS